MEKQTSFKWLKYVLAGILLLFVITAVGVPFWMASFIMKGKRQTLEEAMAWQSEHYDTSFYDRVEKTDYTVAGFQGYELHVQLLKNPQPTDQYVIISHGYTDNRCGALKYARIYLDFGYNCIIYDLRGHGLNERTFTTYGIRESQDLLRLINDTKTRYPGLTRLGLHGESLGAATSITVLKEKPDVDFVVADCGFADIESVLRGGYKSAHIPDFFVDIADFGARMRYHYSFKEMRPVDALDDNHIPILFIHGEDDDFIPPRHSREMYERTAGEKDLKLIPGAGHAESVLTEPENYQRYVKEFLDTLN